jgi:hypothetical protein
MKILPDLAWLDVSIPDLSTLARRCGWPGDAPDGIMMGEGRTLSAEDVLEGHYCRLANSAQQSVVVQPVAQADLGVAISALAPHLAPLTELAEDVAETVPAAHPSAQFRADLHRALQRTHQQQVALRFLHTDTESLAPQPWFGRITTNHALAAGIPLLIGLLICALIYQKDGRSFMFISSSQSARS